MMNEPKAPNDEQREARLAKRRAPKGRKPLITNSSAPTEALTLSKRIASGKDISALAQDFCVHPATIRRRLEEAKQGDLVAVAREMIAERLVPKALAVFDQALNNGDKEIAEKVLFGMNALVKGNTKANGPAEGSGSSSGTPILDQIRRERQRVIDVKVIREDRKENE